MRAFLLALLMLLPGLAMAEEVVLGLSSDQVAITTSFDGSEILIFGAVKRERPIPAGEPLEVVITVAGPSRPVMVRRKDRWFGIWVNTDAVEVDRAPSFYAVATTAPMNEVLSNTEDLRHRITIDRAIRSVGAPDSVKDSASFTAAIIRIRRDNGLYQMLEGQVALDQQTLFRTAIRMPANLTEGDYITRIYLTRGGQVVSSYQTSIDVRKVGLERWLFGMSREQPMLYGLMSLAIAIAAGWGASAAFRLLRN
ncbi:TIGR02186 family protein [Sedimentitalea arenosa]|uniref:TIGR02186 family protein n=1 Tax=Sedimentitalea arenosa TaxID=2798803 RepID=A0A8J7IWN4_9RHOB|nr:TIGR02186 family protein [Arenibacterium arenosum]MBJ6372987.1 TIGR02186 family protein [Arenibacterium arenosum]